jgi:hypothetical protein
MISEVVSSFACADGLSSCRKIIVCDKPLVSDSKKKKTGRCTPEEAAMYTEFIDTLQADVKLPGHALYGCEVLDLKERHGFGMAVKRVLEDIETPYIMIVHHDQQFLRRFDCAKILRAMRESENMKYIGFASPGTLKYKDQGVSKYQLKLEERKISGMTFVQLLYWFDRTHICCVDHYRKLVFGPDTLISKGSFIEDCFGHAQLADIKENGLSVHAKYGSWLLTEEGGMEIVTKTINSEKGCYIGHLDGRRYVSPSRIEEHKQARLALQSQQRERGTSGKSKKQQRKQQARDQQIREKQAQELDAQDVQPQESVVDMDKGGASNLVLWVGGIAVAAALVAVFLSRQSKEPAARR